MMTRKVGLSVTLLRKISLSHHNTVPLLPAIVSALLSLKFIYKNDSQ